MDKSARCDLLVKPRQNPPKNPHPERQGDYGSAIEMPPDKPASFMCAGDTVYDPNSPVLGDGGATTVGSVMCFVNGSAVSCLSLDSSHGFLLSRTDYKTF